MTKRKQTKAATLPTIEQPKADPPEAVEVTESDSTTVGGVTWVDIRVPVFVGDLSPDTHRPDGVSARLIGHTKKTAMKRVMRGIGNLGLELVNGKKCKDSAQHVIEFFVEQVAQATEQHQASREKK